MMGELGIRKGLLVELRVGGEWSLRGGWEVSKGVVLGIGEGF